MAADCWRHNVNGGHLQSCATRDGKKTPDGKKKNEMTQVQLNITQPVPSGIPSDPNGDALLLLDREDSRSGGGMRVPQLRDAKGG